MHIYPEHHRGGQQNQNLPGSSCSMVFQYVYPEQDKKPREQVWASAKVVEACGNAKQDQQKRSPIAESLFAKQPEKQCVEYAVQTGKQKGYSGHTKKPVSHSHENFREPDMDSPLGFCRGKGRHLYFGHLVVIQDPVARADVYAYVRIKKKGVPEKKREKQKHNSKNQVRTKTTTRREGLAV